MTAMHPNRVAKRALAFLIGVALLFFVFSAANGKTLTNASSNETTAVSAAACVS